jgi:hypothetical protein
VLNPLGQLGVHTILVRIKEQLTDLVICADNPPIAPDGFICWFVLDLQNLIVGKTTVSQKEQRKRRKKNEIKICQAYGELGPKQIQDGQVL